MTRGFARPLQLAGRVLGAVLGGLLLLGASRVASAQAWPARPLHVIVDGAPGSTSDLWARRYIVALQRRLNQPFVVDNRPGASGSLAVQALLQAPHDGHTLLYATAQLISYPGSGGVVPYDPVRDLVPAAFGTAGHPILLASGTSGVRSLRELVAYAKTRSAPLTCGTGGTATIGHYACALAGQALGLPVLIVPYKSIPAALQDAGAGTIDLAASFYTEAQGLMAAGRLAPLAVYADERFVKLPDVPTFDEQGYRRMTLASFNGFYFAAGTPAAVVQAFNEAARWSMRQAELVQPIQAIGSRTRDVTVPEFAAFFRNEYDTWRQRSETLHIQAER